MLVSTVPVAVTVSPVSAVAPASVQEVPFSITSVPDVIEMIGAVVSPLLEPLE